MNKRYLESLPEEQPSFWMSYADIMAGLLFIFILILLYTVYDYRTELGNKQEQIDRMLGLRRDIISTLTNEFKDTNLQLEIDTQTGAIRFPGGVFFAVDSYSITEEGKEYLKEFVPRYVNVILGSRFRDYIAQIIIEGHTDNDGTYLYNLELSQNRTLEAAKYILGNEFDFTYKDILKTYLTANGRSFSHPVLTNKGKIDKAKSRRVEFKFRLRDEEMISDLRAALTPN